jgi:hypothetical protein
VKRPPALIVALALAACTPALPPPESVTPNKAGLVTLPCRAGNLRPAQPAYCWLGRGYVTPVARVTALAAADRLAARFPGTHLTYMDASGADGHRPFKPHLSHGDGREIDFGLFFTDEKGRPLPGPPTTSGYGAYEPPRPGEARMCVGVKGGPQAADPPATRSWRLDEARTKTLVLAFTDDPRVRRVFLEPHLKLRLGLSADAKVRFQGCRAARHDDHLHVDFY